MPSVICPLSYDTVLDPAGRPLVGAKVYIFVAETTQQAQVYSDSALTKPFGQPILTTGYGRVPAIYLPPGAFRVRLTSPDDVIMDDVDDVQGAVVTEQINNITNVGFAAPTGCLLPFYGTGAPSGWVRANGKSIGGTGSAGSEFADDSTQALFVELWNADPSLAVSGGRGNTALEDFKQGKTIALPDFRRRVMVGLDGMGNGFLNYLGNGSDPYRTLGAQFGEEVHILSVAEMPTHSHIMSCDVEGGHIHAAQSDIQGLHGHGASADVQGSHTHSAGMDVQGGHVHGASMDVQGQHSHPAGMDVQGAHQHSIFYYIPQYSAYGNEASGPSVYGQTTTNPNGASSVNGDHQHNITINPNGAHIHNITIAEAGDHLHNITIQNNGSHSHTITITAGGSHSHNITIADAGEHSHVVQAANTGGGAAHNNIQPSTPVTILIKL